VLSHRDTQRRFKFRLTVKLQSLDHVDTNFDHDRYLYDCVVDLINNVQKIKNLHLNLSE
jgi:hypothetical protein